MIKYYVSAFILVSIVVAYFLFQSMTPSLDRAADQVVLNFQNDNSDYFLEHATKDFRRNTPRSNIQNLKHLLGSQNAAENIKWNSQEVSDNVGVIKGIIVDADNDITHLSFSFLKQDGRWMLQNISMKADEIFIPSQEFIESHAHNYNLLFTNQAYARDFMPFYGELSQVFKKQVTYKEFSEKFATFKGPDVDLRDITNMELIFDSYEVEDDKVVDIKGHYVAGKNTLAFEYKFVPEDLTWRPYAFSIKVE